MRFDRLRFWRRADGTEAEASVRVCSCPFEPEGCPIELHQQIYYLGFEDGQETTAAQADAELEARDRAHLDVVERAWGIIANAGSGEWQHACTEEWIAAAERFRDEVYHPMLAEMHEGE